MAPALGPALIWCPFPEGASADAAAATVLDERLVACANILPPMRSLFVWQGEQHARMETGVLFKTDAALLDRAIARIFALHPDEEPAILAWRCDAALAATAAWLAQLAGPPAP